MAISQERLGQLALIALKGKMRRDGIHLNPKDIKREITNEAKNLGVPVSEAAEFALFLIKYIYEDTTAELERLVKGDDHPKK